jgi:hypothetical protein
MCPLPADLALPNHLPGNGSASMLTTFRFCDRAGLVNGDDGQTRRSTLLSVVGAPTQDADCGGRDAPKLYLGLNQAMGKSELIPSVVLARDVTPSPRGAGSQEWQVRSPGGARGMILTAIMLLRRPEPRLVADPPRADAGRTVLGNLWNVSSSSALNSGWVVPDRQLKDQTT